MIKTCSKYGLVAELSVAENGKSYLIIIKSLITKRRILASEKREIVNKTKIENKMKQMLCLANNNKLMIVDVLVIEYYRIAIIDNTLITITKSNKNKQN